MQGPGCPLHCPFPPQCHPEKADKREKWQWLGSLLPFFKLLVSQIPAQPLHLPAPPPPSPLAKFQGFEEVSRSLATSPVRPQEPDSSSQAVGWHLERCLPAGTPPLPTSSPHSAFSRAVSLSIAPSRSRPSSRPARSPALRFHPPIPSSPTSSFIPLPSPLLPAPACPTPGKPLPSGSAALKAGSLPGGGSGWSAAALLVRGRRARPSDRDRDRSAPATARIARPPDGRSPAGLGSGPTPAPPRAPLPPLAASQLAERPSLPLPPPPPRQVPAAATLRRPGPLRLGPGTPAPRQPRPRHHVGEERGGSGRAERQGPERKEGESGGEGWPERTEERSSGGGGEWS